MNSTTSILKPNFLCIGAAKAGTTTLYHVLKRHPQVFVTTPKEINFFSRPERYQRGWEWYLEYFRDARPEHLARGEFGNNYSMITKWVGTVQRIKHHLPEVKLIYMVRDPVQRLESAYMESRLGRNRLTESFSEFLRGGFSVDSSRYWLQYDAYREAFGASRIHVIFLEDYRDSPADELRRLCQFLEIETVEDWGNLQQRYNTVEEKREDTIWLAMMRRLPGFSKMRDRLPRFVRNRLRSWFKHKDVVTPRWSEEDYQYVIAQLREDTRKFLAHFGKPPDFWTFEPKYERIESAG